MIRSALFTLLALAACGPEHREAPAAQPPAAQPPAPPSAPAGAPAGGAFDITKPCSMITAAEVGAIVGFTVTSVDEHFRCKFPDAKGGWLSVKLLEASSQAAKDICDYARDKRTVVAGVGEAASYLGSTACAKVGDVMIVVDGASVAEHSPQLAKSGADNAFILIAKTIASRIP